MPQHFAPHSDLNSRRGSGAWMVKNGCRMLRSASTAHAEPAADGSALLPLDQQPLRPEGSKVRQLNDGAAVHPSLAAALQQRQCWCSKT